MLLLLLPSASTRRWRHALFFNEAKARRALERACVRPRKRLSEVAAARLVCEGKEEPIPLSHQRCAHSLLLSEFKPVLPRGNPGQAGHRSEGAGRGRGS